MDAFSTRPKRRNGRIFALWRMRMARRIARLHLVELLQGFARIANQARGDTVGRGRVPHRSRRNTLTISVRVVNDSVITATRLDSRAVERGCRHAKAFDLPRTAYRPADN